MVFLLSVLPNHLICNFRALTVTLVLLALITVTLYRQIIRPKCLRVSRIRCRTLTHR